MESSSPTVQQFVVARARRAADVVRRVLASAEPPLTLPAEEEPSSDAVVWRQVCELCGLLRRLGLVDAWADAEARVARVTNSLRRTGGDSASIAAILVPAGLMPTLDLSRVPALMQFSTMAESTGLTPEALDSVIKLDSALKLSGYVALFGEVARQI